MTILLGIFLFLFFIWNCVVSFALYKTLTANFDIQDVNQAYKEVLTELYDTLVDDTSFLKSSLMQRLSMDIPEVSDLHKKITAFERKIISSKVFLQQLKLLDVPEIDQTGQPEQKND